MTNGDWIRSLTDEELEKHIIHPCHNFKCGGCQLANERGKYVLEQSKTIALEWLESEREK